MKLSEAQKQFNKAKFAAERMREADGETYHVVYDDRKKGGSFFPYRVIDSETLINEFRPVAYGEACEERIVAKSLTTDYDNNKQTEMEIKNGT